MDPLSLDPEQPRQPELRLADVDFLREMESRSGEMAAELAHARQSIDRIGAQLGTIGIEANATTRVLFAETFETARETGKSLGFDVRLERRELTISAIVGDSRHRQDLAPYFALVDFKAGRFRAARANARRCIKASGEWPLGASLLSLTISGECAIAALRFAGFLRSWRIVEVVDVVRHAALLDGISARLEAVAC